MKTIMKYSAAMGMWSYILRVWGGKVSFWAWRSRRQIIWALFIVTGVFLFYVQMGPSSPTVVHDVNDPQLRRSLNSFGPRAEIYESKNRPPKVQFIENENLRRNQMPESNSARLDTNRDISGRLYRDDMIPKRDSDAVRLLEQRIQEQNFAGNEVEEPPPIYDANKFINQESRRDIIFDDAVPVWAGAAARFNPYGEPVYDHGNRPNYIPKERVVHLDLKGAPPLISAIRLLIPWLAKYGATTILLEYEDMFPWEGPLISLAAKNHYSKKDINEILALCHGNNIDVIPLVQTFGHLEHALKGKTFAYLREVPEIPQALCPSKNESFLLVQAMVDQMMALHPRVKYLHLGCDEVFQIGECELCRQKMRDELFLEHVSRTARYVRKSYGTIPLVWHDMLTHISAETMKLYQFGSLVEPMIWVYAEDVYRFVQPFVWTKFSEVFPHVWVASAFKGAFGEQSTVPNIRRHLDNNLNWLDVMNAETGKFSNGIRGIVLTGWQRFDHFAVLAEVLPAAMPSLAINLIAVTHGYFNETLHPLLYEALSCVQNQDNQNNIDLDVDPFLWEKFSWCFFPGALTFKLTSRLETTRKDVRDYINRVKLSRAWITDYNRRHNFSSPMRVDEDLEELSTKQQFLQLLIKYSKEALSEWFDGWTVGEWVEQHIWPLYSELSELRQQSESMKNVMYWPVRPLPLIKGLEKFGITEPPIRRTKKKQSRLLAPNPPRQLYNVKKANLQSRRTKVR